MEELYKTDFLIKRLFDKLENVERKRFKLPKIVMQKLNKKIFIVSFLDLCKTLNRDSHHFKLHLEKELNTTSSITADGNLLFNTIYPQDEIRKHIESYVLKYVICSEQCLSGDTEIIKNDRITFLHCKTCNSRRSI
jgi:translation initiation factor 2 subunit 2